jgi:protein SCO1
VFSHVARGSRGRGASIFACLLGLAVAIGLLAGCGGSGGGASSSSSPKYAGVRALPSKSAPPLALTDSLGHPVNIDQYRGKAVLVTFIYDHCPDICPLMVGNLHNAQAQLGPQADKLQIIAVSVDPRGDTPRTVAAFLREHQMTGRMEYLIGSRPQLERTWRDWSILSKATPTKRNPDLVEHSALVYGISASGRITTLYQHDFVPSQIVHDVPVLASQ